MAKDRAQAANTAHEESNKIYYINSQKDFNTVVVSVALVAVALIAMNRLKLNIKNNFYTVFWFIKLAKC